MTCRDSTKYGGFVVVTHSQNLRLTLSFSVEYFSIDLLLNFKMTLVNRNNEFLQVFSK